MVKKKQGKHAESSTPDALFWEELFQENPAQVMVHNPYLFTEVAPLQPGSMADLCCGTGENLLYLVTQGWHGCGVDWSPSAIAYAEKVKEGGAPATFYCADARNWQSPDGQLFDLVLSSFAIPEGKEDARQMLGNAIRLLKPRGRILVFEWDNSMEDIWNKGVPASEQVHNLLPSLQDIKQLLPHTIIEKERILSAPSELVFPVATDRRRRNQEKVRIAYVCASLPVKSVR